MKELQDHGSKEIIVRLSIEACGCSGFEHISALEWNLNNNERFGNHTWRSRHFSRKPSESLLVLQLGKTLLRPRGIMQEEGLLVSSYVLKMKGYIDNLERLGHPVTLGLGNYNMHSMGKTVNELHAMLKLHEQTLPKSNAPALNVIRAGKVQKGNKHKKSHSQTAAKGQNHGKGKHKQAYALKPKIPPPPKRENPTKDSICHECREIGHWKRNCPQYLAELMKKKKNTASGAGGSGSKGW
nr:zinc finger, CCHC-type [Tanacetum cinerariifolium]